MYLNILNKVRKQMEILILSLLKKSVFQGTYVSNPVGHLSRTVLHFTVFLLSDPPYCALSLRGEWGVCAHALVLFLQIRDLIFCCPPQLIVTPFFFLKNRFSRSTQTAVILLCWHVRSPQVVFCPFPLIL